MLVLCSACFAANFSAVGDFDGLQYALAFRPKLPPPMQVNQVHSNFNRSALLTLVGLIHLLAMWRLLQDAPNILQKQELRKNDMFFIKPVVTQRQNKSVLNTASNEFNALFNKKKHEITKQTPTGAPTATVQHEISSSNVQQNDHHTKDENHPINRDVKALTKGLEREWAQDERKAQAAKPPNQLVREYWEKQNYPYKDKWDELASKIEKAGVARGPQEESYTLSDGSRITKINGNCYKAPDPGRTYLAQPEVRRVFCPRN